MRSAWMLLAVLTVVAGPLFAADGEWRLEKEEDGIRIYSRVVEGWEIREMRGESRIRARLSSLVAAASDPAALPELNSFVEESTVVRRESPTSCYLYTRTSMPWPLKDRDVVVQRKIAQDPRTGAVTVVDTAVTGIVPEREGLVRITRSTQQWTFTPAADGSIAVELRTLSDPAGPIPTSLINSLSVSTPFKTIERIGTLTRRALYAEVELAFVREPARSDP